MGDGATVVRLRPTAHVAGAHVRLQDVARIRSADVSASALPHTVLASTPAPGQTLELSAEGIRNHLERAGVNMAKIVLAGPATVVVHRRDGTRSAPDATPARTAKAAPRPDAQPDKTTLQGIRNNIERFVLKHVGRPAHEVHVDMDLSCVARCVHRHPLDSFQIRSAPAGNWIGRRSVVLVRYENGRVRDRVHVPVKIGLYQDVVVATRSLSPQTSVQPTAVTVQRRLMYEPVGGTFSRVADVVGQRTVRALSRGAAVRVQDVAAIPLVFRGDAVTVVVHGPGFMVRCVGRAKEDGMLGRSVQVQRLDSRETFLARVTGPRRVEVRPVASARATGVVQLGRSQSTTGSFGSRWSRSAQRR